jgi:endonuclease/exonuclease/phosphatase (EEP) superfamily protein YafD
MSKNASMPRDGTVIFWPGIHFELLKFWSISLGTQNALFVRLQCKHTGLIFVVCGVHLKGKAGYEEHRAKQIHRVLAELKNETNVLLVGDFNDVPDSVCVKLVENRGYKNVFPENFPTTAKIHKSDPVIRCIDYMWYKGTAIQPTTCVTEPSQLSKLEPPYLPNEVWPSDHACLRAKFKIY